MPTKLRAVIVESSPIPLAEAALREWKSKHEALWCALGSEDIQVSRIRGPLPDGRVGDKASYTVYLTDEQAAALAEQDGSVVLLVVPTGPSTDVDREFADWWSRHPALRQTLGEDGYIVDETRVGNVPYKRYRVELTRHTARALWPGFTQG